MQSIKRRIEQLERLGLDACIAKLKADLSMELEPHHAKY